MAPDGPGIGDTPGMRSSILMLGLAISGAAAGCGFHSPSGVALGSDAGSDSGGSDASSDGCASFAKGVDTCQLSFDADLIISDNATYDTDSHVLLINGTAMPVQRKTLMFGTDQADVISAGDVHLLTSKMLRATGAHGLVIVASHDVIIDADAQIDVSKGGAGARTVCPSGATKGGDNGGGGGGGGGGGYGADGGGGGGGNSGVLSPGGMQGKADLSFPAGFHGGCPGADGGSGGGGGGAGGSGGKAGGALYIVAGNNVTLNSTAPLKAGGAGGLGGNGNGNGDAGGGGGGSGGLLIVEAAHVVAPGAVLSANGGAGGEGSDRNNVGVSGGDATVTIARASGGAGGAANGGDGGDGGSAANEAGDSVAAAGAGGGGGGGSVGWIRIHSTDIVVAGVSPQATN